MRQKIWIIIAITSTVVFLMLMWLITEPPRNKHSLEWQPGEKEYVTARMRYHGIEICYEENGVHYFDRDGKRCKL